MHIDQLKVPARATRYLAERLGKGQLVLVLGAGTSAFAGLPEWWRLIVRIREARGLSVRGIGKATSADRLQELAAEVRVQFYPDDPVGWAALVRDCLYKGHTLSDTFMKDPLLIGLGALIAGGRRGSVRRIVTLNYDSLLEWYLSLSGVDVRVVSSFPDLEGNEDVRIYHVHGFLPHPSTPYQEGGVPIVLDLKEADERIADGGPWQDLWRHVLSTGVCLFVGVSPRSFRDRALGPLLLSVSKSLKRSRPTGFWLMDRAVSPLDSKLFLERGIVPVHPGGRAAIPQFLLGVCRKAAESVGSTALQEGVRSR